MPSAQVTITQLPSAGAITGTELVPIVQNGQTVKTTTAAIAASPAQTQTFITLNQEPTLANSRALSGGTGIGLVDGGPLSTLQIILNGAAGTLESLATGFVVKSGGTVVNRTLTTSANGIAITNANGASGDPQFSLSGIVGTVNSLTGTGIIGISAGTNLTSVAITGTANQIDVANGTGPGNPTISISSNPVIPGTGAVTVPVGTTGERPGGSNGQIRYNTSTGRYEGYGSLSWQTFGSGDGTVTSVDASGGTTGLSFTGGPITGSGVLTLVGTPTKATNIAGGAANKVVYQTGVDTTGFVDAPVSADTFLKWNGSGFEWGAVAGAGTVTSVGLAMPADFVVTNSPVTSSGTLTAAYASQSANTFLAAPSTTSGTPSFRTIAVADVPTLNQNTTGQAGSVANSLTINNSGAGDASGATYNGSAARTISYNTVGAPSVSGTNATGTWGIDISGNAATATSATSATTSTNLAGGAAGSIPYQSGAGTTTFLAQSSGVLVGGPTPSYSTAPTLTGTNFSSIPNGALQNSSITIGSTGISLGSTASTLAGLTSVSVTQAPTSALQLATKQYVDDQVAAGIDIHTPVRVETPTALNATYTPGGTAVTVTDITGSKTLTFSTSPSLSINDQIVFSVTSNGIVSGTAYYVYSAPAANQVTLSLSYNGPEITTLTNGTGLTITGTVNAGVGATLTNAGANAAIQIDGVTLSATNRVLVYNQANAFENGIYTVTTVGTPDPGGTPWVLTRATDANKYQPDSTTGLGQGDYFFVQEGLTGAGESYVLTTNNPLIIGTTNLTFTQFAASQVYSAGTGLTLTGTTFSLTSPVVTTLGGTGLTSYTTGDTLYYAAGTALSKLSIGASTTIMTSTGSAPQWSTASGITVGTATNATNIAITDNTTSASTWYLVISANSTGNNAATTSSTKLSFVPSTGILTATGFSASGTSTLAATTVSGTLTGSAAVTFSGTTTNISIGTSQTSGTLTLGGTAQTGTISIGRSTGAQTLSLGTGATTSGTTKTINLGTGGVAGSTTTMTIGSTNGTSVTANGTWTYSSTISGTVTNANNVAVATSSTNASFYPAFFSATTGNLPVAVDADLTYNPSTNTLTAGTMVATTGIFGGTF